MLNYKSAKGYALWSLPRIGKGLGQTIYCLVAQTLKIIL